MTCVSSIITNISSIKLMARCSPSNGRKPTRRNTGTGDEGYISRTSYRSLLEGEQEHVRIRSRVMFSTYLKFDSISTTPRMPSPSLLGCKNTRNASSSSKCADATSRITESGEKPRSHSSMSADRVNKKRPPGMRNVS